MTDKQKKALHARNWRAANPEKVRAANQRARSKPGYRERANAALQRYRENHPEYREKQRLYSLQRNRLISYDDFLLKVQQQDGTCAICGILLEVTLLRRCANKACLDHNHETGQIRDVLCSRCNTAFGLFQESEEILLAAISYHRRWAGDGQ